MSNIVETSNAERIVFGGDLNVNINKNSPHALAVNDFLRTYKIKKGYSSIASDDQLHYTFGNEKSERFSIIDFLCISENWLHCVKSYDVVCDVSNFSDHLPVLLTIDLPPSSELYKFRVTGEKMHLPKITNSPQIAPLRWDKGDKSKYYDMTRTLLYPLYNEL